MSGKSTLFVTIIDARNRQVRSAQLILRSRGGERSGAFRYDANHAAYVSEPVSRGDYLLDVEAGGYATQEVPFTLRDPEIHTSISIGREGEPYYFHFGRRVYFETDGDRLGALMQSVAGRTPSPGMQRLRTALNAAVPDDSRRQTLMIVERARLAAVLAEDADLPRTLRDVPEVDDVGPLMNVTGTPDRILSSFIEVIVEEGVTREELKALIRPFAVHVHVHDASDARRFLLESDAVPTPGYGALPEHLERLDGIRSARSLLAAPVAMDHAVTPGDVLFPLQFHDVITRVREAWGELAAVDADVQFGSPDVIVAIHDSGIELGTGGVPKHLEFDATLARGDLASMPGVGSRKVLFAFNFSTVPMQPGNAVDLSKKEEKHGTAVGGIISAVSDGVFGTVGIAGTTRLCSYEAAPENRRMSDALEFIAGLSPAWIRHTPYTTSETFAPTLNSGRNPIPGAHIINCSHTLKSLPDNFDRAMQRITYFGRNRRGTLVFASAGNLDEYSRASGVWGENINVIRVSASSLDLHEREVRMNYSSYADANDHVIDFATPSASQNIEPSPMELVAHAAPRMFGIATALSSPTSGAMRASHRADLMQTAMAGTIFVNASWTDLAVVAGGHYAAVIRDRTNPLHAELHLLRAAFVPDTLELERPLGYSYAPGDSQILRLAGEGYTTNFGGTSAAAPQAAAIAALILSVRPDLTWLEVREIMRETAVRIAPHYRGGIRKDNKFRYRWLDPSRADLLDDNGLLLTSGPARKISVYDVTAGSRYLPLDDVTGIHRHHTLVIGAETALTADLPKSPDPKQIDVARSDDFKENDVIFVGKDLQTVLISTAPNNDEVLWVQSIDGFEIGDEVTVGTETHKVIGMDRMSTTAGLPPQRIKDTDAESGLRLAAPLAKAHPRGATVRIASTQFEGPFTVVQKGPGWLTLDKAVTNSHPKGRVVRKLGTEIKAVVREPDANVVEIDRLAFDHSAGETVRIGPVAHYSLAFGYGRLDALLAVQEARKYTRKRDLVIRNFLTDDGATNTGEQEVESPDVWIINRLPDAASYPKFNDPGPHETPLITIDPAVHIGSGRNDLDVVGTCTSAAETNFMLEIDGTGATDTFKWSRDGVAVASTVAVTAANQSLGAGVSVKFASKTGHTLGDRWLISAREITDRSMFVRVHNRGTEDYFSRSQWSHTSSPTTAEVACVRILLCVSDGFPVCRFYSPAITGGKDDLQVVSPYNGPDRRALFTVEIQTASAGGDTYVWYLNGQKSSPAPIVAGTDLPLSHGVAVRFGLKSGHAKGDRWDLYARAPVDDPFLNIDHYWDIAPGLVGAFDPAGGGVGTRVMDHQAISGLEALNLSANPEKGIQIAGVSWPEALRPPTNSPNRKVPPFPRRLFALGEVVPHDGVYGGVTAKDNNNVSFREIAFAKFRFTGENGIDPPDVHIDVDIAGNVIEKKLRVEVRTTAGTFAVERVRLKVTRNGSATPSFFRYDGTAWAWDQPTGWLFTSAPRKAKGPDPTEPDAAGGEQFDVYFLVEYDVNKSFTQIVFEAQILSDFRDLPVASAKHTVNIYPLAPLPMGQGAADAAEQPVALSHAFTDFSALSPQLGNQAFGPVDKSPKTRYRTTSLFRAPNDVPAFAVTDGEIAIQRNSGNDDTVNLILRPRTQPIPGLTPVRYFIYRGLRLDLFLAGKSGASAKRLAPKGTSMLIDEIWTNFENLNGPATEIPATVLGYDSDQDDSTALDDLFFRSDPTMQLHPVKRGVRLGEFHAGGGSHDFGFEIMVQEGDYAPDLEYAREASHEVKVSGPDDFDNRLEREKILDFIDPAAFYGLHLLGKVETPTGTLSGSAITQNVVDRFATRNRLYLDIRSEHGSSLNFQRNYNDGNGNQLQVGETAVTLVPRPYAFENWPIVAIDNTTPANTTATFGKLFLQLRRDDNVDPVVYFPIAGLLLTRATSRQGFLRGAKLGAGPWTSTFETAYPTGGPSGAKRGVAWLLRLYYGRLEVRPPLTPVPSPPTVLKTANYTDNVFGPVDRGSRWKNNAPFKWRTVQANRYVDADSVLGWRQMMQCGVAHQTAAVPRVLFYAVATERDFDVAADFIPLRAIPDGTGKRSSFFAEPGLFGVYLVEHDEGFDGTEAIPLLQLRQTPNGYPPSSALLLGLTGAELTKLQHAGSSLSKSWGRMFVLDAGATVVDANNRTFYRYRVGVQGLTKAGGEYASAFPSTDVYVYSSDRQLFASREFAKAEQPPQEYLRNYEEQRGLGKWPARERAIAAATAGPKTITIADYDWRREVVPGVKLKIAGSDANKGEYVVDGAILDGSDTVIFLVDVPASFTNSPPRGHAFTVERNAEDVFIDLDQFPTSPGGVEKMRVHVDKFVKDVGEIPADENATAAILAKIEEIAPKILRRAQYLSHLLRERADDHDRTLYWARNRLTVAVKSHACCLKSFSARNKLLDVLEIRSRGYDLNFNAAPAGAKKVLLTGFDPYALGRDIETSNPSGAVALALSATSFSASSKWARIETAIFPVRYRDFDARRVEALADAWLDKVDMILTVSQNGSDAFYDLERFAGRKRGPLTDNELVRSPGIQIGGADHQPYYESTIPSSVVPDPASLTAPQKVYFDQSFIFTDNLREHPTRNSADNVNVPKDPRPLGYADEGSGGNYLSNEIFYRVAHRRTERGSQTVTGHFHIPGTEYAKVGIAEVIAEVERLITRWLAM